MLEHAHGEVDEALALRAQPFLELASRPIDGVQEVTAVKHGCFRAEPPFGCQLRKLDGIDLNTREVKRHRLSISVERIKADLAERLTNAGYRLFQAIAGLCLPAIGPQQTGKPFPRLRLSGGQRQIREQQAVLTGWQRQLPPFIRRKVESAQKCQPARYQDASSP